MDIIQYNAMLKFVGVLDNPLHYLVIVHVFELNKTDVQRIELSDITVCTVSVLWYNVHLLSSFTLYV